MQVIGADIRSELKAAALQKFCTLGGAGVAWAGC